MTGNELLSTGKVFELDEEMKIYEQRAQSIALKINDFIEEILEENPGFEWDIYNSLEFQAAVLKIDIKKSQAIKGNDSKEGEL